MNYINYSPSTPQQTNHSPTSQPQPTTISLLKLFKTAVFSRCGVTAPGFMRSIQSEVGRGAWRRGHELDDFHIRDVFILLYCQNMYLLEIWLDGIFHTIVIRAYLARAFLNTTQKKLPFSKLTLRIWMSTTPSSTVAPMLGSLVETFSPALQPYHRCWWSQVFTSLRVDEALADEKRKGNFWNGTHVLGWKSISSQYGKYMKIHYLKQDISSILEIFPSTLASLGTSARDSQTLVPTSRSDWRLAEHVCEFEGSSTIIVPYLRHERNLFGFI